MTRNRKTTLLVLSILAIGFLILSSFIVGKFSINGHEIKGILPTWTLESALNGFYGDNTLSVEKLYLEKMIKNLSYVEEAKVKIRGNKLVVEGKMVEKAVVLTDRTKALLLLPSSASPLPLHDIPVLQSKYLVVFTSSSVISLFETMEENILGKALLDVTDFPDYSGLITYAEYDNNKSSIFSGSLRLVLGPLDSVLTVRDLRNSNRIGECLEIIRREYEKDGNKLSRGTREYILDDSLMEKTR